jgi:hypothetical protein
VIKLGFIEILSDLAKRMSSFILGWILVLVGLKLFLSDFLSIYSFVGIVIMLIGAAMVGRSKRGLQHRQEYVQNARSVEMYDIQEDEIDWMDRADWEIDRADWEMDRADRHIRQSDRRMGSADRQMRRVD